jgi:CubicO group peptidase (beta-lactamase class C family)
MLRTLLVFMALFMPVAVSAQGAAGHEAEVDRIFAKWTASTPGCAVGVSIAGKPGLARAYGMADLEHGVPNTADTIFESGSVAKQFTAAAVLLLASDGKLSLDDQVRKYIPELPDYGMPLTIRHMLTHTSGLRDWGGVAAIGGWPRGTRTYTHAHVLDIVSRQHALNFTPGARYSYSNTGYNLAAILVSRVSGMSFAEFTRRRIFEPLGMTRSSWRDDYTRIVKDRAIAYEPERDGFRLSMPFENVHGNGGMLTTVGDLLKWAANFASPKVGDAAFVRTQIEPGRFSDGRAHGYAMGLQVGAYKGVRAISHGGATAGYRTQLSLYPDQGVAVAVLCNAANADAGGNANAVADIYLGNNLKARAAPSSRYTLTSADYAAALGLFRDTSTGLTYRLIREGDKVRIQPGPDLVPLSATEFLTNDGGGKWQVVDGGKSARFSDEYATVMAFEKVSPVEPSAAQLQELAGTYISTEAEAQMTAVVEDGALVLKRRPAVTTKLTPVYADAFTAPGLGLVIFRRDAAGRVEALSLTQDRVWDLRFARQDGPKR